MGRQQGGDGVVMRHLAQQTVVKYHRSETSFRAEKQALEAVRHPCVIRLLSVALPLRACYLPLFDADLMQVLLWDEGAPNGHVEHTLLATSLLGALAACHAAHVVHQDVKPDNVLVRFDPLGYVLCDFGRSVRLLGEQGDAVQELPVTRLGTLLYVAPEAGLGRCMTKNDCWGAGVVLFAALERELPYEAPEDLESAEDSISKARCHAKSLVEAGDPPLMPLTTWPSWAPEVLRGLLRVSPEERFTAEEALARLEADRARRQS